MRQTPEPLWGIAEVATYLGVPASSIYKLTSRRARLRIPHLKLGGRLRFRKADVDEWLELWKVSHTDTLKRAERLGRGRRERLRR